MQICSPDTDPCESEVSLIAADSRFGKKVKCLSPNSLVSNGLIVESLIKHFTSNFQKRLSMPEFNMKTNGKRWYHPNLPYMLVDCQVVSQGKVSRVLMGSGQEKRQRAKYVSFYTVLIGWIYDLHKKELKHLKIPTKYHTSQHRKLLEWLENEICSPAKSLPVLGNVAASPSKVSGGEFGPIQLKLIEYFSVYGVQKHEIAPKVAVFILEHFQMKHLGL
jgi:hypothetical protein